MWNDINPLNEFVSVQYSNADLGKTLYIVYLEFSYFAH